MTPLPTTRSFKTLNRTVRIVGLALAVLAGVVGPAVFAWMLYSAEYSRLAYRTELAARRVAEYAYTQGDRWRFSDHRISEFVAFLRTHEHQSVFDASNRLVTEVGAPIQGPSLRIEAPIVAHGKTVGVIQAESSLAPILTRAGLFAGFGLILGAAIFLFTYLIPLRALRAAIAEHAEVQRGLQDQVEQTQTALRLANEAIAAKSAFFAMMSH